MGRPSFKGDVGVKWRMRIVIENGGGAERKGVSGGRVPTHYRETSTKPRLSLGKGPVPSQLSVHVSV